MATAIIAIPAQVKRNEAFEIRATLAHPMETGYRSGSDGKVLQRNIVRQFFCSADGVEIFRAELHPAIAANPYIAFFVSLSQAAELSFEWKGDEGFVHRETKQVKVE